MRIIKEIYRGGAVYPFCILLIKNGECLLFLSRESILSMFIFSLFPMNDIMKKLSDAGVPQGVIETLEAKLGNTFQTEILKN